jgi:sulfite reductase (NADPH) flavoprotein alpha-component
LSFCLSIPEPGGFSMAFLTLFIAAALFLLWGLETYGAAVFSPDALRAAEAGGALMLYLIFAAVTALRGRARDGGEAKQDGATLVVYASQTGVAEELARKTVAALEAGGQMARLISFSELDDKALSGAQTALFVVSTTGEGDPPDMAARFAEGAMAGPAALSHLRFAVLALGDSNYRDYCAFGRRVDTWLKTAGAGALFERIDVDCVDESALERWFKGLSDYAGADGGGETETSAFGAWRLAARHRLNPGSENPPVFHVALECQAELPEWQAGDIAVVAPSNDPARVEACLQASGFDGGADVTGPGGERAPLQEVLSRLQLPEDGATTRGDGDPQVFTDSLGPLPRREYSLASLPQDGRVELVVRQMRGPDGRLGLGSGWLTAFADKGGLVEMRVRPNVAFHGPAADCPMILVGAGSGIAGLRAHLKERIGAGRHRNWLVFGERDAAVDYLFREEIEGWHASHQLERLDLCFMEEGVQRTVQDALVSAEAQLRRWLDDDGVIYVSGSRERIGAGVDAALAELLGADALAALVARGGYRKDVY